MVFMDLERAYERVPREILRRCLEKNEVTMAYIRVIRNMYDGVRTSVKTVEGDTEHFSVDVVLHQGLVLSPFLFAIVMDELT